MFNHGDMSRDFTYIDDIVHGIMLALDKPPHPNEYGSPHSLYNLGNHRPTSLFEFIAVLEQALGRPAVMQLEPMQKGEVKVTYADITQTREDLGFDPKTAIETGIRDLSTGSKLIMATTRLTGLHNHRACSISVGS